MGLTSRFFSFYINRRLSKIDNYQCKPVQYQNKWFEKILANGKNTLYGKDYKLDLVSNYNGYKKDVLIVTYKELQPYIKKIKSGEKNILSKTPITSFATTSGTISGKKKYIPVTKDFLKVNHFKGGKDLLTFFHKAFPKKDLYRGKTLFIGGSFESNSDSFISGDLSAIMMKELPFWVRYRAVLPLNVATLDKWSEKLEAIVDYASTQDVRVISGVPSWVLLIVKRIVEKNGVNSIYELWPSLYLYMHGGVSFLPYKNQFDTLFKGVEYVESYNSTEGYFALQYNLFSDELLLLTNHGVFYEFKNTVTDELHDISQIEVGKEYALIISTISGLYRYNMEDVVRIVSKFPFCIKLVGRESEYLNICGEKLTLDNVSKALYNTLKQTNSTIVDYTVSPSIESLSNGFHHQWLIEFEILPNNLDHFTLLLDKNLKLENRDYRVKREAELIIKPLKVINIPRGVFYKYLENKNQLGGQHKISKLSNSKKIATEVLNLANDL